MKKSKKILSTVAVSSALLTTVAVATSVSANNVSNANNVDMQLGITADNNGRSAKLSVHNVNMTNAFDLDIKIEGDVEFKNLDFTDNIKQNAITKVNYDESLKVLNIVVTSDTDLAKGGILEIGNIVVDGAKDAEYKILDNNSGITMITPTYDEISDNDLQEIGDIQITVGENVQPPVEDDGDTELPPVNGDDTATPPSEGDTELPPVDEEQNPQEPPTNGDDTVTPPTGGTENDTEGEEKPPVNEDVSVPTEDIEVTEGQDGYKIVTPKTKDALGAVINAILAQDTSAKIIDIKEEPSYYVYKVKYKKTAKSDSEYGYLYVKVSKTISDKEGLPGIDVEKPNDQNQGNETTSPDNGNTGAGTTNPDSGNTGNGKPDNDGNTSEENGSIDSDGNNNSGNSSTGNNTNSNSNNSGETSDNENTTENPKSGDNSILGFLGLGAIASGALFVNLRKKNKK